MRSLSAAMSARSAAIFSFSAKGEPAGFVELGRGLRQPFARTIGIRRRPFEQTMRRSDEVLGTHERDLVVPHRAVRLVVAIGKGPDAARGDQEQDSEGRHGAALPFRARARGVGMSRECRAPPWHELEPDGDALGRRDVTGVVAPRSSRVILFSDAANPSRRDRIVSAIATSSAAGSVVVQGRYERPRCRPAPPR
jgi:hypothetical protein